MTAVVFVLAATAAGATVAGPGLTWDEPAYRHSQVTLQAWFRELADASTFDEKQKLFAADVIAHYWQFNRFGHNFHPPMGSYLNLLTWSVMRHWWDDVSARRLASALQFAAAAAMLCHFLGRRYGVVVGVFSALSFVTMPRLMGHAHLISTDTPLMFLWAATALAFLNGLRSRWWQWVFALSWACLFLVKFTGAVIGAPLLVWFAISAIREGNRIRFARWLKWSALLAAPLAPLALTLLLGARSDPNPGLLENLARIGMVHSRLYALLFAWPLVVVIAFYVAQRKSSDQWPAFLEIGWIAVAVTPLACIALNPTWWHDPVRSLAEYFDLNLNRKGALPDIGIFYLGKKYLYSLPPSNAYVLAAITIPFGALGLGLLGSLRALVRVRRDSLGAYFLLQALTLPLFRMLPTPAHDGARLFLPTFFFWAGLAGLGAAWIADCFSSRSRTQAAWALLYVLGPVTAGWHWLRIHPHELSYYNVGLARAVDWGFEPTYWYDAVTPGVLDDLNEHLPKNVVVGLPHPLINTETFFSLKHLGRLRSDVRLDPGETTGFSWAWLLTHSSKATAYTRLLYACPPWYESGYCGVRLFAVVDADSVALAFALHLLCVDRDQSAKAGGVELNEPVFETSEKHLLEAVAYIKNHSDDPRHSLDSLPAPARFLVQRWLRPNGRFNDDVQRLLNHSQQSLDRAADLITRRPEDVRKVIVTPGYLRTETFGGVFR